MSYLISIFVLLIPWILIPIVGIADQLRLPKAFVFDFMCLGIICFGIANGLKFTYRNKYLSWFSLWIFLTMIFNWYWPIIIGKQGVPQFNVWALDGYIHYLLALFASIICLSSLERSDYIKILKAVCLSSVLVTIFAICQISGFDPVKNIVTYKATENNHFSALIDHPNMIGNYLVMSIPFFLIFKEWKYRTGLVIVVLGVFLSKSSLSIFTLFNILAIYYILKIQKRNISLIIIGLLLAFYCFCFTHPFFSKFNTGFTGRITAWQTIIEHIKDNPLFGQGLGITKMLNIQIGNSCLPNNGTCTPLIWTFAHNDYLELILQVGLLGLILFLFVVGNAFKNFNYSKDNGLGIPFLCSFIAFLIIMMGSFPMETAPCALTGIISWWGVEKIT